MTQLSKHFSLRELTRSQTASRRGIENTPSSTVVTNLRLLCAEILEPVRELLGVPLLITSGYRSAKLNKAIGSTAPNSAHIFGNAADFEPMGMGLMEAFDRIRRSGISFDQLIQEAGPDGWIHIARANVPRGQVFLARGKPGKWSYFAAPPLEDK